MMTDRTSLLEDEFTRGVPEGLRKFTPGLFLLAKKMGLYTPEAKPFEEVGARATLAMVWMLDERTPLDEIRVAATQGLDFLKSQALADYEFSIGMPFYLVAKAEIDRTNEASAAGLFKYHPKPAIPGEKAPPGKS